MRPIPGHPKYFVDKHGAAFSPSGRKLQPRRHGGSGALHVTVFIERDGKRIQRNVNLARAVLGAFAGQPWKKFSNAPLDDEGHCLSNPMAHCVTYLDGDQTNCRLSNLVWREKWKRKKPQEPAWCRKPAGSVLSVAQAVAIKFARNVSIKALAGIYKVSRATIYAIRAGFAWGKRIAMLKRTYGPAVRLHEALRAQHRYRHEGKEFWRSIFKKDGSPSKQFAQFNRGAGVLEERGIDPNEYAAWLYGYWPQMMRWRYKDDLDRMNKEIQAGPQLSYAASTKAMDRFQKDKAANRTVPSIGMDFLQPILDGAVQKVKEMAEQFKAGPDQIIRDTYYALPPVFLAVTDEFQRWFAKDENVRVAWPDAPDHVLAAQTWSRRLESEGTLDAVRAYARASATNAGISITAALESFLGLPASKSPNPFVRQ